MCTMTHFVNDFRPHTTHLAPLHPLVFQACDLALQTVARPRFQVIPAGRAFFHIKETSTGRVRGFRTDHNQACALARSLAARS
jgi:hypothetical protein